MRWLFLFVLLISTKSFALSCFFNDQMLSEYSSKYKDVVQIQFKDKDNSFFVNIQIPNEIEGHRLNDAELILGDLNAPVFRASMAPTKEKNSVMVSYQVAKEFAQQYIFLSYGNSVNGQCPFYIKKEVINIEI